MSLFGALILNQYEGEIITNEEYKLLPFLKKQNPYICVLNYVDILTPNQLQPFHPTPRWSPYPSGSTCESAGNLAGMKPQFEPESMYFRFFYFFIFG